MISSCFGILLQVKCLRVLQYFPVPDDPTVYKGLENVLKRIITGQTSQSHPIPCSHCWKGCTVSVTALCAAPSAD